MLQRERLGALREKMRRRSFRPNRADLPRNQALHNFFLRGR